MNNLKMHYKRVFFRHLTLSRGLFGHNKYCGTVYIINSAFGLIQHISTILKTQSIRTPLGFSLYIYGERPSILGHVRGQTWPSVSFVFLCEM